MSLESINSLPKTNGNDNKLNKLASSLPKDKGEKLLREQEAVKQDTRNELSNLKNMMMQEVALNDWKWATEPRDESIPEWIWALHDVIQEINKKTEKWEEINPDDFKLNKKQW